MQMLAINSLPDYGVLAIIVVSLLGVVFLIWFLIALILDVRRADRRLNFIYVAREGYLAQPAEARAALDDFKLETKYVGHSLDSGHDNVLRRVHRLRIFLRPREVRRIP
jgi:hypothetical protein